MRKYGQQNLAWLDNTRKSRYLRESSQDRDISWDVVKQFVGEDYEMAYVPLKARELLSRFDECAQHYEIREQISY
jgi:hypothetical protein